MQSSIILIIICYHHFSFRMGLFQVAPLSLRTILLPQLPQLFTRYIWSCSGQTSSSGSDSCHIPHEHKQQHSLSQALCKRRYLSLTPGVPGRGMKKKRQFLRDSVTSSCQWFSLVILCSAEYLHFLAFFAKRGGK